LFARHFEDSEVPAVKAASRVDRLILWLRWPWLAFAFALVWLGAPTSPVPVYLVYLVLGGAAVLAALLVGLLLVGMRETWVSIIGVGADVVVGALLLLMTGGANGPVLPVALYPVAVAAVRWGAWAGVSAAVPPSLVMAGSVIVGGGEAVSFEDGWITGVLLLLAAAIGAGLFRTSSGDAVPPAVPESEEIARLKYENRRAAILREMATILSSTLDYRRVVRTMLDLSVIALGEEGRQGDTLTALVLLLEAEGDFSRFRVSAGRNIPRSDEQRLVSGDSGVLPQAIYGAEPVISGSPANDPMLSSLMCMQSAKSALCVPLRSGFDIFGVVLLASDRSDRFTDDHAELLTTFVQQAVISVRNAQLFQDLKREERRLLEKEAEARQKLARELHDGPTQTISALVMRLNFVRMMLEKDQPQEMILEELQQIEDIARHTTQEVRTMLFTLRPVVLETQGLVAALKQYADRVRQDEGLNVKVEVSGYGGQLGKEAEGVFFSIVEEAVGNVRKHAKAQNVVIHLGVDRGMFVAEIQDDGVGFDADKARQRREVGHMGLLNIEERTRILGGRYTIESAQGKGTRVLVELPLGAGRG
jgi:signal transduction histidine kinase